MKLFKIAIIVPFTLLSGWVIAQPSGEASEPTPEELDAGFTAQDTAREASAWSQDVIDRSNLDSLGRMTAAVGLVVRGVVELQQVIYDENDLPFTHTTFNIHETLKGAYPEPEITVVYEGGPSKTDKDSVVITSDARYFSVGEEEVLFLDVSPGKSSTTKAVSIAHRFRIHGNKVYGEDGLGLIVTPSRNGKGHSLAWSADRNPAPQFGSFKIGSHTFTKNFTQEESSTDAGGDDNMQAEQSPPDYRSSVDVGTFSAAITDQKGD